MFQIDSNKITEVVAELCIQANYHINEDIFRAWMEAFERETHPLAKEMLGLMIKNASIAWEENIPICQDTGLMVFFIEKGSSVEIIGESLTDAINKGVEIGGKKGYLRKSVTLDPMRRNNAGSYGPAIIHYREVPGYKLRLSLIPVGCGGDNCSCVEMLTTCDMETNVKDFLVRKVKEFGSKCCPPSIIGVGLGGDLEYAAYLARKALCNPIGKNNKEFGPLATEILKEINDLGIGPQGFGGNTTTLAVNIEAASCHRANLPIAVAFNCHIGRYKEFVFQKDKENTLNANEQLRQQLKKMAQEIKFGKDYVQINTPLNEETTGNLKAGDKVLINGTVYTARDAAHKKLRYLIENEKPLPFDLNGQIIYYVGPTPPKPGYIIGAAGPTTSSRMDVYTPSLLARGLKGTIGKGCRSIEVVEAIKKYKGVYFSAFGGLGALISKHIVKSELIAYEELGTEAIRKLELKDFPAIVTCDSRGLDLYSEVVRQKFNLNTVVA